jgi:hypothetical protein
MRITLVEIRSSHTQLYIFNTQKTKDAFQVRSMKKNIFLKKLKTRSQLMNLIGNLFLKRLMNLRQRTVTISMQEILLQDNI